MIYWPHLAEKQTFVPGMINITLTVVILFCSLFIFVNATPKWMKTVKATANKN